MNSHKAFKALTCVVNHQLCPQMKQLLIEKEEMELELLDLRLKLFDYVKRCKKAEDETGQIYCEMCEEWTEDYDDDSQKVNRCLDCVEDDYIYCGWCSQYKLYYEDLGYINAREGRLNEIGDFGCLCVETEDGKKGVLHRGVLCCIDCCKCGEIAKYLGRVARQKEIDNSKIKRASKKVSKN